ncbi:predicted protein [Arabidopsis lyrata subsp. lyrata]|uniref:Predicted protein n=1 Tax=Arabidopsis lyrata subsp. lyrata TaxID=81972 RepID=D7MWC5_ARALL|nr:predicted protein [Arabidopsis lyrata subsp. lyrata]
MKFTKDKNGDLENMKDLTSLPIVLGLIKRLNLPVVVQENVEETDIIELKAEAAELQNDLILKESETLEVLKELEATKATVVKLQQRKEVGADPELIIVYSGIRASVELLKKKLNEEKTELEKTRERLMQKSLKVISLEEEEVRLSFPKKGDTRDKDLENNAMGMLYEVKRLSREAQEVKKTGEDAHSFPCD